MLAEILKNEDFCCAVSATTRQPRTGDVDGVNYYFMSREEFEKKISENAFLEYAEYCGNYYGTLVEEVDSYLNAGKNVILEIEVQGAMKIKSLRPDTLMIFVVPPSIGELRRRLNKRGTEIPEVIERRVAAASEEISKAVNYDYIIVNDGLEEAVEDFFTVVKAERLKTGYSAEILDEVMKNA
jgi:guanylate kinase